MPRLFAELGVRSALAYIADRVVEKISRGTVRVRRYVLFVQPLTSTGMRIPPNMRVYPLDQDFEQLPLPVPAHVIAKRLAQGSRCYVLEIGGKFAGYAWFQPGPYDEDEVRCTFLPRPASVVWDYDIYIVPEYRRTRAFAALWELSGQRLREAGFTHTASRIAGYNSASIRSHKRLGAREVSAALFVTVGAWQCAFYHATVSVTKVAAPCIPVTTPPTSSAAT